MESAKFRFTNQRSVALEFEAEISTVQDFQTCLAVALKDYIALHPNCLAALHMHHENRWLPLNKDSGTQTIIATTTNPELWAERMAQEILNLWQDTVHHSDQINALIHRSIDSL